MKLIKFSLEAENPTKKASDVVNSSIGKIIPTDSSIASWNEQFLESHHRRISFDIDYLLRHSDSDSIVVDIGSAPPLFLLSAQKLGFSMSGIDIMPDRFNRCIEMENLKVFQCDIEREPLPFDDAAVDVVVINEVFEHLRINLVYTFSEILRVLRSNGYLILSTPNLKSLNGMLNYVFHNKAYSCAAEPFDSYMQLDKIGHMGHVREYTYTEVCEFLNKVGFISEHVIFRGRYKLGKRWKSQLAKIFPSLSPFMSIIAKKI